MNAVDRISPRVTVHDFRRAGVTWGGGGFSYEALLTVEPAVGEPYKVRFVVDLTAMKIGTLNWRDLTAHQKQHWAGHANGTVSRLLDRNGIFYVNPGWSEPTA